MFNVDSKGSSNYCSGLCISIVNFKQDIQGHISTVLSNICDGTFSENT